MINEMEIQNDLKECLIQNNKIKSHKADTSLEELKKTMLPLMAAVAISNILYTCLQAFYPIYI